MKDEQELCIKCLNCIKYKKLYHCDFDVWTNKKINDIMVFVPQMFDCEYFEEYKGNNKYIED